MVRLDDVAKLAGVSKNTASRVLNNRGYLSAETRRKVQAAIKELNYHPNENARNLLRQRSGVVGLLVPIINYPHHAGIISTVEHELSKLDQKMLLCNTEQDAKTEWSLLQMFQRNRIEGLITMNRELSDADYADMAFPIVSIDWYIRKNASFVASNHRKGGRLAAEILLRSGCRNLLQVAGAPDERAPWNERHVEFETVITAGGAVCHTLAIDVHKYTTNYSGTREMVRRQLLAHPSIDGFFGGDTWAVAALQEAAALGMRVPQDLKIVAYDGTVITEMTTPTITCIRQDTEAIGKTAVRLLHNMMEKGVAASEEVIVDVELIQRESTAD